jgi:hypothetical protein
MSGIVVWADSDSTKSLAYVLALMTALQGATLMAVQRPKGVPQNVVTDQV